MKYDVAIIGTGMGALTAGTLLAREGFKVVLVEQNWQPGGCTSSYWRKGFVFETGATTLVGLDGPMPLNWLLNKTGIELNARKLELPMIVHLADGSKINRYQHLEAWIKEAESHFTGDQRAFWTKCFEVSEFVWQASTRYLHFPASNPRDLLRLMSKASLKDLKMAQYALISTAELMRKYQVDSRKFRAFIDDQLLITAQNSAEQVNFLFGAAALCYTNYPNYYVDGGLLNLVSPFVSFIRAQGGEVYYRQRVEQVEKSQTGYRLITKQKEVYESKMLISGIPINNTLNLFSSPERSSKTDRLMDSKMLYSAFQMGIGFKSEKKFDSLHHQIHVPGGLVECGSNSFFLSLSHSKDPLRSDLEGCRVASISTHIQDPENSVINKEKLEKQIIRVLIDKGFLQEEAIVYRHSSSQKSWEKWTNRAFGFVGGYPQFLKIKPWNMINPRLKKGLYQCGDTAYPGQGIPGATLSGIIAAEKLKVDWN